MILYITTSGTKLSKESGMIIISDSKGVVSKLPKEQIVSTYLKSLLKQKLIIK